MARLSFKDVGVRLEDTLNNTLQRSIRPIGIKTPLELGDESGDLFVFHYNLSEQVKDNLKNLLLTNHGERLALYDFGANLKPLLTEKLSKNDFDNEAMIRINTAVTKWMPFVSLDGFESKVDYEKDSGFSKTYLFITYSIPAIKANNQQIEVELYSIG